VLARDRSYVVKNLSDSTKKFSETDIINMLEFLIDNIYVMFGGRVYQQKVGIPMGTNSATPMRKLKSSLLSESFVLNRPSLSISRCRSRYEADLSVSVVSFISSSMG
jgi:hypothetical protein